MATKKATAKKPTAKTTKTTKAAHASPKKTVTKKASAKRTAAKNKSAEMQSFRLCKEPQPFMSFKPTRQTAYWLIIAVMSIAFTAWIFSIQSRITDLYNQIEMLQASEAYLNSDTVTAE